MTMQEIWLPLQRFDGCYEISTFGHIRRLPGAFKFRPTAKLLSPYLNTSGYWRIGLRTPGTRPIQVYVHQLVAETFIGPNPGGFCINHKDANKHNNRADNLEYITYKQNSEHAKQKGLYPSGHAHHYNARPETRRRGETSFVNKLTEADVLEIRERLSNKETKASVAARFNISISHIKSIKRRLSWSHI